MNNSIFLKNTMMEKPSLNIRNKMAGVLSGLTAAFMSMSVAFAAEGGADQTWVGAQQTLTKLFQGFRAFAVSVAVPIAAAVLVFCFIMMMFSQNQRKVEMYRSWVITIALCIVAVFAVDFIVNLAKSIGTSLAP